jgi:CheY-like chemotaxis protein
MSEMKYKSVLLIDDSEIDVLVNRRLMELTGFCSSISVFHSAEDGLKYLQEECGISDHAPDWIFLDMHLPVMDGYEFIEQFASLPFFITEKTKIIVLSVLQKPEHVKKVFSHPFVIGQIEKPLTREALQDLSVGLRFKV